MSENRSSLGTIYGRFQPLHRVHLHMARQALERCEELTVGITNPDPNRRKKSKPITIPTRMADLHQFQSGRLMSSIRQSWKGKQITT